jgi:hypothetical protein
VSNKGTCLLMICQRHSLFRQQNLPQRTWIMSVDSLVDNEVSDLMELDSEPVVESDMLDNTLLKSPTRLRPRILSLERKTLE